MKTLDQWTDRLEELIEEEAWHKPPTGEPPAKRAMMRLATEMRDDLVAEMLKPLVRACVEEFAQGYAEGRDRPR
jgi:hypothetical protein